VAVVADDLTGAADSGVQLAGAGYRTAVAFLGAPVADGFDAVVADTDSRAAGAAAARERVRAATARLAAAPILLKKVDSTLRGPVGEEIAAALEASGRERAVIAPAFPATGRTTVGGVQLVDGVPVQRTRFADDPVTPVREGSVPALLAAAGVDAGRCVVADACSDGDLDAIVRAERDPSSVLWVGSAGLARALAAAYPGPGVQAPRDGLASARTLVVVGSASDAAREQVARLAAAGAPVAELRVESLDVDACARDAAAALARARVCVLRPAGDGGGPELARRIARALADVVARVAGDGLVTGLVLTGGDTAVHVARRLGATGLRVDAELEPGVPIGRLLGPRPYPVVTKAGGFGSPDVLRDACEALAQRERKHT